MEGVNELYTVINLYYLGHYQQCINEASKIRVSGGNNRDNWELKLLPESLPDPIRGAKRLHVQVVHCPEEVPSGAGRD